MPVTSESRIDVKKLDKPATPSASVLCVRLKFFHDKATIMISCAMISHKLMKEKLRKR